MQKQKFNILYVFQYVCTYTLNFFNIYNSKTNFIMWSLDAFVLYYLQEILKNVLHVDGSNYFYTGSPE